MTLAFILAGCVAFVGVVMFSICLGRVSADADRQIAQMEQR